MACDHLLYIVQILPVSPLDLGQCLAIKVVMMKRQLAFLPDEWAAGLPSGQFRNEIRGASQFYIDLQILFKRGKRFKEFVLVGNEPDIDIQC
ncbi:MAG: hypothetical protein HY291_06670 [Planctomycetes bacterium]|nr:hypothetical protein [Planctomycetota bacterium]